MYAVVLGTDRRDITAFLRHFSCGKQSPSSKRWRRPSNIVSGMRYSYYFVCDLIPVFSEYASGFAAGLESAHSSIVGFTAEGFASVRLVALRLPIAGLPAACDTAAT